MQSIENVPINIVGSSIFGRYPKISLEKTYNMFISDDWLINYAGFEKAITVLPSGEGRALFHSIRGEFLITVVSSSVYLLKNNLRAQFIGQLDTFTGPVFMDENLSDQICIVDGQNAYIYNYDDNTLTKQVLTFLGNPIIPSYVCYHNTFFLIASSTVSDNSQNWYAFEMSSTDTISLNTQFSLQTKPDSAIAIKRIPGGGNNVLVLGTTVGELWTQVGGEENYRRVQSFNIDNGVVAIPTIAASDEFIFWLSQNENNSPIILMTGGNGQTTQRISTDGIDNLLASIKFPEQSTAIFFRQDGHFFYQLTFYNPVDNLTLLYDLNTKRFYHCSDENLNFHPARQIVFFNGASYFVSINDANIYKMGTEFVTYNYQGTPGSIGEEIPRIRICNTIRKQNTQRFRIRMFTFMIEQGVNDYYILQQPENICTGALITEINDNPIITENGIPIFSQDSQCGPITSCTGALVTEIDDQIITEQGIQIFAENSQCTAIADIPRVDLSLSKNGNQSFSSFGGKKLNPNGIYRNQIRWHRLGQANELTIQLRFWGFQRFVVQNGECEIML